MSISRTKLVGFGLAIFAGVLWLYWPSVHGEFLAGDDVEYLRQSVRLNGLTWSAVKWAFTCTDSYYHPLVRLSHVLDYQIWGKNAACHHTASVVVHALNAALVFGFLWTLLGATSLSSGERLTLALWVAVVFAIHPLQVESVAWVSGRTQLLCTTFGIGSVWAYATGARRWVVWGLYVAALLCKPMAISLPFVMLAIDYYPLRRHKQLGWSRLMWEKAAMIVIAVAASLATLITKSQTGQIFSLAAIPLSKRVFLAFDSLTFYLWKLVWPVPLSPYYPLQSRLSLDQWPVLASVLSVVMITAVVVIERRRRPMLAAGWGAYLMLVLPVSGLIQEGAQAVAPRYAYMAMLPPLLLGGGGAVWLWRRSTTVARVALTVLLAGQLCVFGVSTHNLIPERRNDETLCRAVLAQFPDSEFNWTLAVALLDQGRAREALEYAQREVEIAPQLYMAHNTLGRVLDRLGRFQDAVEQYEQALHLKPNSAQAHYNLAIALAQTGKIEEAITHFQQALRIKPDYAAAHCALGMAWEQVGNVREAIAHDEQALRINPDLAEAHSNLGIVLAQTGKIKEAITHYQQALRIKPDFAEAHYNFGIALEQAGREPEAIQHYEQALKLRPDFTPAKNALARLRAVQTGR